jgi:hypothetical protein
MWPFWSNANCSSGPTRRVAARMPGLLIRIGAHCSPQPRGRACTSSALAIPREPSRGDLVATHAGYACLGPVALHLPRRIERNCHRSNHPLCRARHCRAFGLNDDACPSASATPDVGRRLQGRSASRDCAHQDRRPWRRPAPVPADQQLGSLPSHRERPGTSRQSSGAVRVRRCTIRGFRWIAANASKVFRSRLLFDERNARGNL